MHTSTVPTSSFSQLIQSRRLRLGSVVVGLVLLMAVCLRRCGEAPGTITSVAPTAQPVRAVDFPTWAQKFQTQLPPPTHLRMDPALSSDTLDNGIRCVVLEQPDSLSRISLRLLVLVGSHHEEDGERGYAHFIEHLAFQKSQHAPQGHVLEAMERLGLASGADTNAHTAYDHTLYKLDLPDNLEGTVESGLTFLRDVADGLLHTPEDVEQERRIVLREMGERSESTSRNRLTEAILPNMRVAQRHPIGLESVLTQASAASVRDFWQRHYVSRRMVVVAVGELQREEMMARLKTHFASVEDRPAPPEPKLGDPLTNEGVTAECVSDPGFLLPEVILATPQPLILEPDSVAQRHERLAITVGLRMLSNRLNRKAHKEAFPLVGVHAEDVAITRAIHFFQVCGAIPMLKKVPEGLQLLVREWRHARVYGFLDTEFGEARADLLTGFRKQYIHRLTAPCQDLADTLLKSILEEKIWESPEDEYNRVRADLGSLSRRESEVAMERIWKQPVTRAIFAGPDLAGQEEKLASQVRAAWQQALPAPPVQTPPKQLTLPPLAKPGRWQETRFEPDPGYVEARASNEILVQLKPLAGLGGAVIVQVDMGWGRYALPMERGGLSLAAQWLVKWRPLAGWPEAEFKAALADRELDALFEVMGDRFRWTGYTNRAHLQQQLQLLCACITQPGFAQYPSDWHPNDTDLAWVKLQASMTDPLTREIRHLVTGEDPRYDGTHPGFKDTDSKQVNQWLGPMFKTDRLKVVIVGDFAPREALDAVAATFGALPARAPWREACPYAQNSRPLPF